MRKVLLVACAAASLGVWPQAILGADAPKRPNILLIYADDQSYKTVGCYPESWPWVKTPNIDALAKSGVRFRGAYLGGWCMPSREPTRRRGCPGRPTCSAAGPASPTT